MEKEEKINEKQKKQENELKEKDEGRKNEKEEKKEKDNVYVKRIINVEITTEIKSFIEAFIENREDIINWCNNNSSVYQNKISEKMSNIVFNESRNIDKFLEEKNINIDIISVLVYFYNLYCIHNNKEKVDFHNLMCNSSITYRGIHENIDKNSKTFKNLLKEEKEYKKIVGDNNRNTNDFFSNYKKSFPYGINIILGIFLTFMSGYYGCLLLGYTKYTTRLICGIIFSYVTLILEVIIYIIISEKMKNLKNKQKCTDYNSLYKKINIDQDYFGLEKIDEIKEKNKHSTLKKRIKT